MKPIRVLIIDDEPEQLATLASALANVEDVPFVVEFESSLDAGFLKLSGGGIDAVLLDLYLPDSKGLSTYTRYAAQFPEIPVITISDFYEELLAFESVKQGAQDYLLKQDIQPDHLVRAVRFAIERQRIKQELDQAKSRLEKIAFIDPVTELFNRRGIQEILSHEIQRAKRKESSLLVLLVGLDDFKRINNALGTSVGNVVLKEVAAKLQSALRATDYLARVGSDEFLVLLPDTRLAEGVSVAEKVRLAISTTTLLMSQRESVKITASLGLVNAGELSPSSPSIDELLAKTHVILGKARMTGNNRVSYELTEDELRGLEDHSFSEVLRKLHAGASFYAVMQPIVRLQDKVEIAYEILVRSTVKGFECPDDFFRASLEANILTAVDQHCFRTCAGSASMLPAHIRRHVNLFPSTLIGVPVGRLLESLPSNSSSYCVEISEQQIIGDPSYLVEPVRALRQSGIKIALDDLGFGRSCLESLILLEPDIVKIDKKCVTGITEEHANMRSLKRLLRMATSLGAEVVAEGVESKTDLSVLTDLGVSCAQGYFLGRPTAILPSVFGTETVS